MEKREKWWTEKSVRLTPLARKLIEVTDGPIAASQVRDLFAERGSLQVRRTCMIHCDTLMIHCDTYIIHA